MDYETTRDSLSCAKQGVKNNMRSLILIVTLTLAGCGVPPGAFIPVGQSGILGGQPVYYPPPQPSYAAQLNQLNAELQAQQTQQEFQWEIEQQRIEQQQRLQATQPFLQSMPVSGGEFRY